MQILLYAVYFAKNANCHTISGLCLYISQSAFYALDSMLAKVFCAVGREGLLLVFFAFSAPRREMHFFCNLENLKIKTS